MTKKQYLKAAKAIANGCKAVGQLCNSRGDRCSIGELLHAAGVPNDRMRAKGLPCASDENLLYAEYGLCYSEWRPLMRINDEITEDDPASLCNRRKEVIKTMKRYVKEPTTEKGNNE